MAAQYAHRSIWTRLCDPKDRRMAWTVAAALLVAEAVLCSVIVWRVPYTEIDWVAYMQEVEGFLQGEYDYVKLRGDTGPLVYPAGFVYIYSALHALTRGGDIFIGQVIFVVLYLCTQAVVFALYIRCETVPPWSLAMLCASKRVHSIFVLRMFNDGIAMLLAYIATYVLCCHAWRAAVVLYSAAVSVKMNVLLMAPSVAIVLLQGATVADMMAGVMAGVVLQLTLGAPFLLRHPMSYFSKAFEFSRVFMYKWTVNWKFLPEDIFLSKRLSHALLLAHLVLLLCAAHWLWCRSTHGLPATIGTFFNRPWLNTTNRSKAARKPRSPQSPQLSSAHITWVVFFGNFSGIVCARSLHYQFYSWYFHTLPLLLWRTNYPVVVKVALFCCIEVVWNVYPARAWSSGLLLAAHAVLLCGLFVHSTLPPLLAAKHAKQK